MHCLKTLNYKNHHATFLILLVISIFMGISGCGKTPLNSSSSSALQTITVTSSTTLVGIGNTLALTGTGQFSDGSTMDLTPYLTWTSSNTSVATVASSSGVVTGASLGTVTITATASSLLSSLSPIMVLGSTTLTVTPSTLGLTSLTSSLCTTCLGRSAISSGASRQFTWTINNSSTTNALSSLALSGLFSGLSINGSSTCGQTSFSLNASSSCNFIFDYVAPTVASMTTTTNTLAYASTTLPWNTTNASLPLTIYPAAYNYTSSNGLSSNVVYSNVFVTTMARTAISAGGPALPVGSILVPASGGGLDYSVNGGTTWLNVNVANNGLAGNSTNAVTMASDGALYVASDSGLSILLNNTTTWTVNTTIGVVIWLFSPSATPAVLYAAGSSNFMRSANRGTSFTNLLAQNSRYVSGSSDGTKVFVGTLSGTYYSTNSGTTNTSFGIGSAGQPFYSEAVDRIYVTQGTTLYRSNVGAYGTLSTLYNFGVAVFAPRVWNNGQNILVSSGGTGLYYSTNGGTSFTLYTSATSGLTGNSVNSITIDSNNTWWMSSSSVGILVWDH